MPRGADRGRSHHVPAHHIVAGVLAFMERDTFSGSLEHIHTTFHKLKDQQPRLFREFVFSTGQNFPYSKLLERVLSELMHSDVIKAYGEVNPGEMTYRVPEDRKQEARDLLTQRYEEGTPTLLSTFQEMARRFEELCPASG